MLQNLTLQGTREQLCRFCSGLEGGEVHCRDSQLHVGVHGDAGHRVGGGHQDQE